MTAASSPQPRTRPPVSVATSAFVSTFDRFAVSPLLVLVAADLGATLAQALMIASSYFLAYGLSQPVWGVLSDRIGRIRLMRWTLMAAAMAGVLSALAPNLAVLVVARAFAGAFFGAVIPASLTYVGDTVDEEHRQPALTDLMAASAVGTALATALAGILGDFIDWRVVFAVPAVLAAGCAIALGCLKEAPREKQPKIIETIREALSDRWVRIIIALAFVEGAVVLGILTLLAPALQAQGVGAVGAGLATAAYGLGVVVTSQVVRSLSRRLSMHRLMAIGGFAVVVGYVIVTVHVSIPTVVGAALLLGVAWSFLHSSLQAWVTSVFPQARGTVVALFAGALFAGSAVGASAGGPLANDDRWTVLFAAVAVVALVLIAGAVLARRSYVRRML